MQDLLNQKEKDLSDIGRQRDSLLASNAELTKQCETIKDNMKNALTEMSSNPDERSKKKAMDKINNQISSLEKSIQTSHKERTECEASELSRLQYELDEALRSRDSLKMDNNSLKNEVKDLKEKIRSEIAESEKRKEILSKAL